jgi:hypothetical protein
MSVITAGQSGASWGMNPEVGVIAQKIDFKVARTLKEELGPQGDAALLAFFNAKGKYSGSGVIVGSTGWAAAAPGVALVIANDPQTGSTYGITAANSIYVDDSEIPQANTEFKKVSFNGTKYANIA